MLKNYLCILGRIHERLSHLFIHINNIVNKVAKSLMNSPYCIYIFFIKANHLSNFMHLNAFIYTATFTFLMRNPGQVASCMQSVRMPSQNSTNLPDHVKNCFTFYLKLFKIILLYFVRHLVLPFCVRVKARTICHTQHYVLRHFPLQH